MKANIIRVIGFDEYEHVTDIYEWQRCRGSRWTVRKVKKWLKRFGAKTIVVQRNMTFS